MAGTRPGRHRASRPAASWTPPRSSHRPTAASAPRPSQASHAAPPAGACAGKKPSPLSPPARSRIRPSSAGSTDPPAPSLLAPGRELTGQEALAYGCNPPLGHQVCAGRRLVIRPRGPFCHWNATCWHHGMPPSRSRNRSARSSRISYSSSLIASGSASRPAPGRTKRRSPSRRSRSRSRLPHQPGEQVGGLLLAARHDVRAHRQRDHR